MLRVVEVSRGSGRKPAKPKTTLFRGQRQELPLELSVFQCKDRRLTLGVRRINAYYRRWAKGLKRAARARLERHNAALRRARGEAPEPGRVSLTHRVTLDQNGLLSLYHDHAESDGKGHEVVCRWADTWRRDTGAPVSLKELCGGRKRLRRLYRLALETCRSAGGAPRAGRGRLGQFLLTPEGLTLFGRPAAGGAGLSEGPSVHLTYEALGERLKNFPKSEIMG